MFSLVSGDVYYNIEDLVEFKIFRGRNKYRGKFSRVSKSGMVYFEDVECFYKNKYYPLDAVFKISVGDLVNASKGIKDRTFSLVERK